MSVISIIIYFIFKVKLYPNTHIHKSIYYTHIIRLMGATTSAQWDKM